MPPRRLDLATFATIAIALLLVACDQKSPVSPKEDLSKVSTDELLRRLAGNSAPPIGYQRFVPVTRQPENIVGMPWSGTFALDTKTGQICLTLEAEFKEPWRSLPKCVDLLNK